MKGRQNEGWIGIELLHISRQREACVTARVVLAYYANENRIQKEHRGVA